VLLLAVLLLLAVASMPLLQPPPPLPLLPLLLMLLTMLLLQVRVMSEMGVDCSGRPPEGALQVHKDPCCSLISWK